MAIITIKRKKGTVHKVRVLLPDGTTKCKTFKHITDARKFEGETLETRDRTRGLGLTLGRITLDEFKEIWWSQKVTPLEKSTQQAYESHYRIHIQPIAGHKRLYEIQPMDGDRLITSLLQKGNNPKGINFVLRTFKTILNYAVSRDYLSKNPLANVKTLKEGRKADTFWTTEEVTQFLTGISDHYSFPLFVTALNTGLRKGEIISLQWDKIDFQTRRITVARTRDRYGERNKTKNKNDRFIPMNQRLYDVLMEVRRNSHSQYVFTDDQGRPIDGHHLYRLFDNLRIKAGVRKKIRFHDLRHTFASHFLMNGGSLHHLSIILDHADFKTTKRYIHHTAEYLQQASNVVSF